MGVAAGLLASCHARSCNACYASTSVARAYCSCLVIFGQSRAKWPCNPQVKQNQSLPMPEPVASLESHISRRGVHENTLLFAMRQFMPPSQTPSGSGLSQIAQSLMYFQVSFVSIFDSWGRPKIGRTCIGAEGVRVAYFEGGAARESSADELSLRGLRGRSLICST